MFQFQILNLPESFTIDETRISRIFELVSLSVDISQLGILNIAFLADDEIQSLNREHRGNDSTTDVLSFHYFDDFSDLSIADTAGEIILSESRIISQAQEHGHSRERECEILVLHSILHIIGFDHETNEEYADMWAVEGGLRKKLG
ncbi:rRNA maturation RNase YbeY [Candidatus Gracilibacteria bacterium]|nr:rRNA maturation RNase YbeY [Candidatus Gracilibacteria bacterium]